MCAEATRMQRATVWPSIHRHWVLEWLPQMMTPSSSSHGMPILAAAREVARVAPQLQLQLSWAQGHWRHRLAVAQQHAPSTSSGARLPPPHLVHTPRTHLPPTLPSEWTRRGYNCVREVTCAQPTERTHLHPPASTRDASVPRRLRQGCRNSSRRWRRSQRVPRRSRRRSRRCRRSTTRRRRLSRRRASAKPRRRNACRGAPGRDSAEILCP